MQGGDSGPLPQAVDCDVDDFDAGLVCRERVGYGKAEVGYSGDIPDKPIIVVCGCKSGAPGGIAQKFSHALDAIVIAADQNSSVEEVKVKDYHGMLYPEVKYQKAKARVYVSGEEINPKRLTEHLRHRYERVA